MKRTIFIFLFLVFASASGFAQTSIEGRTFNVRSYGAKGDGTTNDTTAVGLAVAAAVASPGGILFFPAGTYVVDPATVTIATNSVTIRGDGVGRSILKNRSAGSAITLDNTTNITHSILIENLSISGFGTGSTDTAITVLGTGQEPFGLTVQAVTISNVAGKGIYVSNNLFTSRFVDIDVSVLAAGTNGIDISGGADIVLENCYVHSVGTNGAAYRIHAGNVVMIGCNGIDSGTTADWIVLGDSIATGDPSDRYARGILIGCNIESFTNRGVYAKAGSYVSEYRGVTFLTPTSGTVTPIKYDFVDTAQRGTWDSASSFTLAGAAAYTNGKAINSNGAPFVQIGDTTLTDYYDTGSAAIVTLPSLSVQLIPGSTNTAIKTTRAQITSLEASGLVGDLTGATDFTGATSRVLLQSGTAARPTFTFGSDTDTGFYNSAANTIGFAGGGASLGSLASTGFTLGIPGTSVGALILSNATNSNTTTIQSGVAAASRTYTLPTNFGSAGAALTDAAGNGTLSWVVPSSSPTVTATYVGYGNGSNVLTGTSDFFYNTSTKLLSIVNGSGAASLTLNGSSDTSKVNFGAGSVPGNQGGIVFPFVGGGNSSGPGIWWASSASYASLSGLYINNGLTWQGASSTHDKLKIAAATGTSSNGAVIWEFAPSSSLITQTLSTSVTGNVHVGDAITLTSTGTPAANFGYQQTFTLENAGNSPVAATAISHTWATATAAAETGRIGFSTNLAGAGIGEAFVVEGSQFYGTYATANISGTPATINFNNGNSQQLTLTGNVGSTTLTGLKSGGIYFIIFKQDGTGGRTLASTNIKVSGADLTITSTATTGRTLFTCMSDGTSLYCTKELDIR